MGCTGLEPSHGCLPCLGGECPGFLGGTGVVGTERRMQNVME